MKHSSQFTNDDIYEVGQSFIPARANVLSFALCKIAAKEYLKDKIIGFWKYKIVCDNGDVFEFHDAEMSLYLQPIPGEFETLKILYSNGERIRG